jgi:hypothetical protein
MDTQSFADLVREHVVNVAIDSTLQNLRSPPGRRISSEERARSAWFNSLSTEDAQYVDQIVRAATEEGIFQLFSVLDRSRKLADEDHFELHFVKGNRRILLNDFNGIGLNEAFNAE